jgi:hypothetical protein
MKPINHKKKKRNNSKAPMIINDLRSLTVLIVYPKSIEGEELWEHLTRIGCQIQTCWPPPIEIPKNIDVVFLFIIAGSSSYWFAPKTLWDTRKYYAKCNEP